MTDICICKHHYHDHVFKSDWNRYQCIVCMEFSFKNGYFINDSFPSFHKFAGDNLMYLENRFEEL